MQDLEVKFEYPHPDNPVCGDLWWKASFKKPNDYTRAAARVFMVYSGPAYCCRICNEQTNSTGGGGWYRDIDAGIEHVLREHPEACKMLSKGAHAIAKAVAIIHGPRPYTPGIRG